MIAQANIERILHRYAELEAKMADGGASFAKLAKEYSDLGPLVEKAWRRPANGPRSE